MKQAILITAYKNIKQLDNLILFFDERFEIYIHIDKKSNISDLDLKSLNKYKNIKFISRKFSINWGGVNHLKAIILLSSIALKDGNDYFHLITGQDYPIRKLSEFEDFFLKNRGNNFIEFNELPYKYWAGNGGLERINLYNFYDIFNAKQKIQMGIIGVFLKLQKMLNFNRNVSGKINKKLYGGGTYWSLSKEAIELVLNQNEQKDLLKNFRHSFCAEEIFFQTILLNSHLKDTVINDDLRFINWAEKHGNVPAILDNEDFDAVISSNDFFVRKIEMGISDELIKNVKLHNH